MTMHRNPAVRGHFPLCYTDGIVHGYVETIRPVGPLVVQAVEGYLSTYQGHPVALGQYFKVYQVVILQATTNGKVWSYAVRPAFTVDQPGSLNWKQDFTYVPDGMRKERHRSRTRLPSPYHDLVAWAVKDLTRRAKLPADHADALRMNVAYEQEAPSAVGHKVPGPCGPITLTGYPETVGAYTREQIGAILVSAVQDCLAAGWAWRTSPPTPWKPVSLEVMLHHGERTAGLAFAPGTGHRVNRRLISLNSMLFKQYDADSIKRTAIHEICHHYRDEAFLPNDVDTGTAEVLRQSLAKASEAGKRIKMETLNTHDSIFVRELSKADARVREDPFSGLYFTEYADPSLVAEIQAKRAAKEQKIDWHPTKGRVFITHLKSGTFSVWWAMLDGPKTKVGPLNTATIKALIAKISAACGGNANPDMPRLVMQTAVEYGKWPASLPGRPTLQGLIDVLQQHFNLQVFS